MALTDEEMEQLRKSITSPSPSGPGLTDNEMKLLKSQVLNRGKDTTAQQQEAKEEDNQVGSWFKKRFSDILSQGKAGLVQGGDVSINALEGIPEPRNIVRDPGRVVDYFATPWNAMLNTIQSLGNAAFGAQGIDADMDLGGLRINKKFGNYPEKNEPLGRLREKNRLQRQEWIQQFRKQYKDKYKAEPALASILSYAPDLLVALGGGILDAPGVAAFTEGTLGRGRAVSEGAEDPDKIALQSALGGYLGAKFAQKLFNRLTPDELRVLNSRAASKEGVDDTMTLLKYMQDNPSFSYKTATSQRTGNPVIDEIIQRQRANMGGEAYQTYMRTLQSVNKKGIQSVQELSDEFAKGSEGLYNKMKSDADKAWDKVTALQDNSQTIPSEVIAEQLDDVLRKYGPENTPVKNFTKKLLRGKSDELTMQEIDKQISSLVGEKAAADGIVSPEELKALSDEIAPKVKELLNQKKLFRAIADEKASKLTPQDIIERIKSLNDKQYLAGGSINTHNKRQMAMIADIRDTLMKQLDEFDNIDEFKEAYETARRKSRGIYETFGYSGGKNAGRKVTVPELGGVLDELEPEQIKVVRGMLNEDPAVFTSKLNYLEDKLPPATLDKLKRGYIQQRLDLSAVNPGSLNTPARLDPEKALTRLDSILDAPDGRKMLEELYGKQTLDDLVVTRELTRALKEASEQGSIPKQSLLTYLKELPNTIKTVLSQNLRDKLYLGRQLKAYGDIVKSGYKQPKMIMRNPAWNKIKGR